MMPTVALVRRLELGSTRVDPALRTAQAHRVLRTERSLDLADTSLQPATTAVTESSVLW